MAEILKIIGLALLTSISAILLNGVKPELSFAITITGAIIILLFLMDSLQETLSIFSTLAKITGVENSLFKRILKIVGINYVTEFGVGVLNDFGSSSLADKVALGGKITIFSLSLPIIESFLELLRGFLLLL